MESCVKTILDLNQMLGEGKIKPEIISQFERLKESVKGLSDDRVAEEDIHKIEQATNELLAEIKTAFNEAQSIHLSPNDWH